MDACQNYEGIYCFMEHFEVSNLVYVWNLQYDFKTCESVLQGSIYRFIF